MRLTYRDTLFATFGGVATQAITNNLAPLLFLILQNRFDVSLSMLSLLIVINFGTQLAADLFSTLATDRIGFRPMMLLALGCSTVGLAGLSLLPMIFPAHPYPAMCCAVAVYAFGGGILEVVVSPIVEALPLKSKRAAMSLLHSFYCWGQVGVVAVTTLLLKAVGEEHYYYLPVFWALFPLANLICFTQVPLRPIINEGDRGMGILKLLSRPLFWGFLLLIFAGGATELAMAQWSSYFAEKGLRVDKATGDLLGPCLFAVFMGAGRLYYSLNSRKIPLWNAIFGCAGLGIFSYLLTAFGPNPYWSLAGCALCGLAASVMWPGVFSWCAAVFPRGGSAMFGLLAIAGDLGCVAGPVLAGGAADFFRNTGALNTFGFFADIDCDQAALRGGMLLALIFPALIIVLMLIMRRYSHDRRGAKE